MTYHLKKKFFVIHILLSHGWDIWSIKNRLQGVQLIWYTREPSKNYPAGKRTIILILILWKFVLCQLHVHILLAKHEYLYYFFVVSAFNYHMCSFDFSSYSVGHLHVHLTYKYDFFCLFMIFSRKLIRFLIVHEDNPWI